MLGKGQSDMDFGEKFIPGVKVIYLSQHGNIIINEDLSKPCEIQKGTRQGCPLSPCCLH